MTLLAAFLDITAEWRAVFPRHRTTAAPPMPSCPSGERKPTGPTCLDLIALLRKDMLKKPDLIGQFRTKVTDSGLIAAAAA